MLNQLITGRLKLQAIYLDVWNLDYSSRFNTVPNRVPLQASYPRGILSDEELDKLEEEYDGEVHIVPRYGIGDINGIIPESSQLAKLEEITTCGANTPPETGAVRPAGYITPVRGTKAWVSPGLLGLFFTPEVKGRSFDPLRYVMGLKTAKPNKRLSKIISENPELLGDCENWYLRFVDNHLHQLYLLTTGISGETPRSQLLLDLMDVKGSPTLVDHLALAARSLMFVSMVAKRKKLLQGLKELDDITRMACGIDTLTIYDKEPIARGQAAADILYQYVSAVHTLHSTMLNAKKGLIKRSLVGQRGSTSSRSVLAIQPGQGDTEEIELGTSVLLTMAMPMVMFHIGELNKELKHYSPEQKLLFIRDHLHDPTEDMYQALERIVKLYQEEAGVPGIPHLVQRFPTTRPANASVLFVKKIRRNPLVSALTMNPGLFRSFNGDVDGDEVSASLIPLYLAKDMSEQFSHRHHYIAKQPLPYQAVLVNSDGMYLIGTVGYLEDENLKDDVDGDAIYALAS